MKILISGSTGLVGTALAPALTAKGHEVFKLVRRAPSTASEIRWDSEAGFSSEDAARLEGFDAVVHLAGDNVASENWSDDKKRRIRESRTVGTKVLIDALKKCTRPPKAFISASATGFYGNRGAEELTEDSDAGEGFLPDVCKDWESEIRKASDFGARVVMLRIGIVLSKDGGALEKMLTPFKFGVGGVVGSGDQYMSWIALDDLVRAVVFAVENENLRGPVNATAPEPVTNEEFTKALGEALNRPTIIPVPEFAIKMLYGEMGEALVLGGNRVLPKRLEAAGFTFENTEIRKTLRKVLEN
jgi:uncharacterized protein (TIGR01777 family)